MILKIHYVTTLWYCFRYSPAGFPPRPTCNHKSSKAFQCSEVSMQDVRRFNQKFYAKADRLVQNNFILRHVTVETPKRKRSRSGNVDSQGKQVTTKYYIPSLRDGHVSNVPVCKKMFIETLLVSRDRVQNICKKFLETGTESVESRGGDRKSVLFTEKKTAVKNFIQSIPVLESHYCRGKNIQRQYLSSDLSIKRLWNMYQNNCDPNLKVKYDYFRNIFDIDYNIGFGAPATDCCSTCISLKGEIKLCKDVEKKQCLKTHLNLHKMKATAFFDQVRNSDEGELVFSFDCQKNQVIPKIPDQSSYYLRQIYLYNFTICKGTSHSQLTKDNVFSYVWLENDYKKGSNEIASAVYHQLKATDLTDIRTIKLIADGCGGQNKNSMIIGMIAKFLLSDAPSTLKIIKVVFPVVGHSFIPPDRVFGAIEKDIKKHDTLLTDKNYIDIIQRHATVIRLGEDECPVLDWKSAVFDKIKKPSNWHFKLQPCKRVVVSKTKSNNGKCVVRGEINYVNNIGEGKSILKPGKKIQDLNPKTIKKGVLLKEAKLKDIDTLLKKHFSPAWKEREDLNFFNNIFEQHNRLQEQNDVHQEEEESDSGDIIEEDAVTPV